MNDYRMIDRVKDWSGSLTARLLVTSFIVLLLLIPVSAIKNLMGERENRRDDAVNEVIGQWGGRQYLTGPVLAVPVEEEYEKKINDRVEKGIIRHNLYILPDSLSVKADLETQLREKGIFHIRLYTGRFHLNGNFSRPDNPLWNMKNGIILWSEARLLLGMGDVKGLSQSVDLNWSGSTPVFQGGTPGTDLFPQGISAPVDFSGRTAAFDLDIQLKGGGSIRFFPMGGETNVTVNSDWASPGFTGAFIPTSRQLGDRGFSARWDIQALARNYPQNWIDDDVKWKNISGSGFGVDFVNPVDGYFKSHRAVKYSLLFIFLPFVTLFLFEVFAEGRLHPLQYIMIGLAVCLFFLLLLTLSEQMNFNGAYVIAASASAILISFYTGSVFRSFFKGGIMALLNGLLYLYLFMALASEDYALLIGSIGLFAVLAGVMIFTRKINWYELGRKQ